jgi:NADPH:quinone reductase-like Zn-dependent oxidoreductase
MSRVVVFRETGGPDVLRIEDQSIPAPGPREIKIRVEAIGLNRAEIAFREGRYLERPKLPSRLGYEAAGIVSEIGRDITEFRKGDRVSVIPTFSMNDYGTYGEEILVPVDAVAACPPNLDSVHCASVWMQYLTAYGGLVEIGGAGAGDFILVTAASSSVGLAAIQIARKLGATVIATTRSSKKRDALLGAGATHVVATLDQDVVAEVRKITSGAGVRIVFDSIAGPFVESLAKVTAKAGTIIIYGGLSGEATPFPGGLAMARALTLRGYTLFELTSNPTRLQKAKAFIIEGLSAGYLSPVVDRVFKFDDIIEAHRYMEAGGQIGKVVVTVP